MTTYKDGYLYYDAMTEEFFEIHYNTESFGFFKVYEYGYCFLWGHDVQWYECEVGEI